MSKFFSNRTSMFNIICAILLVVLLVLHFMPFRVYGENGETASIQGYIWFPSDHAALEKHIQETADAEHKVDSILAMPLLVLVLGAAGAVLCVIKADQIWTAAFPIACGVCGMWGYLSKAAFKLGTNWTLHLILCIALVVVGILSFLSSFKEMKNN